MPHTFDALMPIAAEVHPDEPAWALLEVAAPYPDTRGLHRFQLVYVNRGDRIARHTIDLGRAREFRAHEFHIPSLWEHTVGELWDMADEMRQGDDYWVRRAQELRAESTLILDFLEQADERQQVIHNRSVFGPKSQKQRNGFPLKAAIRAITGRG
jgi:hypothetical protein